MSCSVCKSKTHNKRKCPDKDKTLPPPSKRGRGRPKIGGDDGQRRTVQPTTDDHHDVTAQPTRVGRGGRVIRSSGGG
ncbi:hypothetical protein vseg_017687 [Gypsophila vaccaria]